MTKHFKSCFQSSSSNALLSGLKTSTSGITSYDFSISFGSVLYRPQLRNLRRKFYFRSEVVFSHTLPTFFNLFMCAAMLARTCVCMLFVYFFSVQFNYSFYFFLYSVLVPFFQTCKPRGRCRVSAFTLPLVIGYRSRDWWVVARSCPVLCSSAIFFHSPFSPHPFSLPHLLTQSIPQRGQDSIPRRPCVVPDLSSFPAEYFDSGGSKNTSGDEVDETQAR